MLSGGSGVALSCGLVLIFAVLLQSICVAITFLYFTNELQQVSAGSPGRLGAPAVGELRRRGRCRGKTKGGGGGIHFGLCKQGSSWASRAGSSGAYSQESGSSPAPQAGHVEEETKTNTNVVLRNTYSESTMACLGRDNLFLEDLDPYYNEDSDPCWQVKWQLSKLIKKMMARHRIKEERTSAVSSAKGVDVLGSSATEREPLENAAPRVAAHLTANPSRKSALTTQNFALQNNLGYKINAWEPSRRRNSFLYNVELRNGELVVPQTGFYYIYSQTYFRFRELEGLEPDSDPDSDSVRNPKQMVQYISKFTDYPDPILLMKSARTSCWSKNAGYGLYSIYQGGVFHLKHNDRIFVSINSEELVDLDKEASFFGAFLVS